LRSGDVRLIDDFSDDNDNTKDSSGSMDSLSYWRRVDLFYESLAYEAVHYAYFRLGKWLIGKRVRFFFCCFSRDARNGEFHIDVPHPQENSRPFHEAS
jgi:hypothetical protein